MEDERNLYLHLGDIKMDLISNLHENNWQRDVVSNHKGFQKFTIIRRQMTEEGVFRYAISDIHGNRKLVTLDGAKTVKDPLKDIANCEFLLQNGYIVGIHMDDDCVTKKSIDNGYRKIGGRGSVKIV